MRFAIAFDVSSSAGKKASIVTSDKVTSTAVPKTVVVPMKESGPSSLDRTSGTAIPPLAAGWAFAGGKSV